MVALLRSLARVRPDAELDSLVRPTDDASEAGRLADAEQIYRQILSANPNDADALHLLGALAFQVRQYEPAIRPSAGG